jgi:hypothetical protein
MGLSKDEVIAVLQQHAVQYELFEHEAVMTCDAQARGWSQYSGSGAVANRIEISPPDQCQ